MLCQEMIFTIDNHISPTERFCNVYYISFYRQLCDITKVMFLRWQMFSAVSINLGGYAYGNGSAEVL